MPLDPAAESVENRYYAYLRDLGYSTTDALLQVLEVYAPLFDGFAHVADLGAGHGEFLQILRARGHTVAGVDVDPGMVDHCRSLGFDVDLGDAEPWLAERPARFDGIFSSNVIEHLPAETVAHWVSASWRALRPGGVLVLTTPNPESMIVQFHEFWRDPTHVRMYSRQLLEFMLADAGFERVSSQTNPASAWEGIEVMLDSVSQPLERVPLPEPPPAVRSPEPEPPPPGAAWRTRQAWKVSHWVYRKFLEPWLLPLRRDLESDHARYESIIQAQNAAIESAHARVGALLERLRRLDAAQRFSHPPREIYVVGYKPLALSDAQDESP